MKSLRILLLIFPIIVSCSNDAAKKVADEFHTRLENEDYNLSSILNFIQIA